MDVVKIDEIGRRNKRRSSGLKTGATAYVYVVDVAMTFHVIQAQETAIADHCATDDNFDAHGYS